MKSQLHLILKFIFIHKNRALFSSVFLLAVSLFFAGCVGPAPDLDYNKAAQALLSARLAGAQQWAPGYLTQANDFFKKAEKHYFDREYKEAREQFRQAQLFAERAENISVMKRIKEGEAPE